MSNKTIINGTQNIKSKRKSQRGKWGHLGAPPKATKWPSYAFTMAQLFRNNSTGPNAQCQLSLRNKVTEDLTNGSLIELAAIKQPKHAAGRPKSRFVRKEHYDAKRMTLKVQKTVTTTTVYNVVPATPVTAPVITNVSPEPELVHASPAPQANTETNTVPAGLTVMGPPPNQISSEQPVTA